MKYSDEFKTAVREDILNRIENENGFAEKFNSSRKKLDDDNLFRQAAYEAYAEKPEFKKYFGQKEEEGFLSRVGDDLSNIGKASNAVSVAPQTETKPIKYKSGEEFSGQLEAELGYSKPQASGGIWETTKAFGRDLMQTPSEFVAGGQNTVDSLRLFKNFVEGDDQELESVYQNTKSRKPLSEAETSAGKVVRDVANMLPYLGTSASATAAGAAVAGPAGGLIGAASGEYAQGWGESYKRLRDEGVDPEFAKSISTLAAIPYAGLGVGQLRMIPGLKGLFDKYITGKIVKTITEKLSDKVFKGKVQRALGNYFGEVFTQSAQEGGQEMVMNAGLQYGRNGGFNNFDLGENVGAGAEAFKESIGPFAVIQGFGIPGHIARARKNENISNVRNAVNEGRKLLDYEPERRNGEFEIPVGVNDGETFRGLDGNLYRNEGGKRVPVPEANLAPDGNAGVAPADNAKPAPGAPILDSLPAFNPPVEKQQNVFGDIYNGARDLEQNSADYAPISGIDFAGFVRRLRFEAEQKAKRDAEAEVQAKFNAKMDELAEEDSARRERMAKIQRLRNRRNSESAISKKIDKLQDPQMRLDAMDFEVENGNISKLSAKQLEDAQAAGYEWAQPELEKRFQEEVSGTPLLKILQEAGYKLPTPAAIIRHAKAHNRGLGTYLYGEIKDLYDSLPFNLRAKYFSKNYVNLDEVADELRDFGFNYDSEGDFISDVADNLSERRISYGFALAENDISKMSDAELVDAHKRAFEANDETAGRAIAEEWMRRRGYETQAYHGTGADAFNVADATSRHKEFGEGNQAHGPGLYMAESRDTAENYRENERGKLVLFIDGKGYYDVEVPWGLDKKYAKEYFLDKAKENGNKELVETIEKAKKLEVKKSKGHLFDWFHNMKPDEMFDEQNPNSVEKSAVGEKYKKAWFEDILPILRREYGYDEEELDSVKRMLSFHNSAKTIARNGSTILGADRFREIMLKHGIRGITYDGRQDGRVFVSFEGGPAVKLQDAFTFDDNGNYIPLDQRGNYGNPDMRYSIDDRNDWDNISFEKQIDNYNSGKYPSGKFFTVGIPSDLLKSHGISDKRILMTEGVLKKIKKHGINDEQIKNIPKSINAPVGIFSYPKNKNVFDILVEFSMPNGRPIIVSLEINKNRQGFGEIIDLITAHPKENFGRIIDWAKKGRCLYWNKEKGRKLLQDTIPANWERYETELTPFLPAESEISPASQEKIGKIKSKIEAIQKKFNRKAKVKSALGVVETVKEAREILGAESLPYNAKGINTGNKIIVIAQNIEDSADAARVFLHEKVGHFGLRNLLGKDFDPFLEYVAKHYKGSNVWNKIRELYENAAPTDRVVAEELLAHLAENREISDPALWSRLVAKTRRWLKKDGVPEEYAKLLDEKVLRSAIVLSREWARGDAFLNENGIWQSARDMRKGKDVPEDDIKLALDERNLPSPEEIAEANRQKAEVKAKWTNPDGSMKKGYMLAPNGKPTNLSEDQWLQVRTPNFKRTHGDWETLAESYMPRMAKTFTEAKNAVSKIIGKEIINKLDGFIATVSNKSIGKMLSKSAVKKSISPEAQALAVANIDRLFENAELLESKLDRNGVPDIKAIHRYYAPMFLNGEIYAVKITVKELSNPDQKNRIYSVESIDIKKAPEQSVKTDNLDNSQSSTSEQYSDAVYKFFKKLRDVKPENIRIALDENGEPKVENAGTFNPDNPDIRYSLDENGWKSEEAGEGRLSPRRIDPLAPVNEDRLSAAEIRRYFEKALNLPVRRQVHPAQRNHVGGTYNPKSEVVRTNSRYGDNDLGVLSHEIGHYLHGMMFGDRISPDADNFDWNPAVQKELADYITDKFGDKYAEPEKVGEGVAEFVRNWIMQPEAAAEKFPAFFTLFTRRLDKLPDLKRAMERGRELVAQSNSLPALEKVKNSIRKTGDEIDFRPLKERVKSWAFKFKTKMIDELAPLDAAADVLREFGASESDLNFIKYAVNHKGGTLGKAEYALMERATNFQNKEVGPGLFPILRRVGEKNIPDFEAYLVSRRTLELAKRGIKTGISSMDALSVVKSLKDKFEKHARRLDRYQDRQLKLLVDSGILSKDAYKRIKAQNMLYVPLHRFYEKNMGGGRGKLSVIDLANPLKRIKGSDLEIISPIESIIKNTFLFRDLAERNRVALSFVDACNKTQGGGRVADKFFKKYSATRLEDKEKVDVILESGIIEDLMGGTMENQEAYVRSLIKNNPFEKIIFRPKNATNPQEGIFRVFRDGEVEYYQMDDKDLYDALRFADSEQMKNMMSGKIWQFITAPTRILRAGATTTLEFGTKNFIRDMLTAGVYSKNGYVPVLSSAYGIFQVLTKGKWYREFLREGARYANFTAVDTNVIQNALRGAFKNDKTTAAYWLNFVKNPVAALRAYSELMESATRVAEYRLARKNDKSALDAANEAKSITLNFARNGKFGATLNRLIPFFNAGIQDTAKFFEEFVLNKDSAQLSRNWLKGFLRLSLPTIMLAYINSDDEEIKALPTWRKAIFWNFRIPGVDGIWSIPKPIGLLGIVFCGVPEAIVSFILSKDKKLAKEYLNQFLGMANPFDVPVAVKTPYELWANKSFFTGGRIESMSDENILPSMRYGPNTSRTSILAADALSRMGVEVSPKKIDYTVRGYTAGLGTYALSGSDAILKWFSALDIPEPPDRGVAGMPIVKSFAVNPYTQSRYVGYLMDEYDKCNQTLGSARRIQDGRLAEKRDWINKNAKEVDLAARKWTILKNSRNFFSRMSAAEQICMKDRSLSAQERKERLMEISNLRNEFAKEAWEALKKIK